MKIRHAELNECLRNPAKWVAKNLNPPKGGPRNGYSSCLRGGIYHFHKELNDVATRQHIRQLLVSYKLNNPSRIQDILKQFDLYVNWYYKEEVIVADHKLRIELEVGSDLVLGGEVSRIDIIDTGYRAILLGSYEPDWRTHLRMPLIQRALAEKCGRPEEEIYVGHQELDSNKLQITNYSTNQIEEAEAKVKQLAEIIKYEITKQQANKKV